MADATVREVQSPNEVTARTAIVNTHTSSTAPKETKSPKGVAAAIFFSAPAWFHRRYPVLLQNVLANIPRDWVIQLFVHPHFWKTQVLPVHPGLARLLEQYDDRIVLVELPADLQHVPQPNQRIPLNPWFWKTLLADRVLLFSGNGMLCTHGNTQEHWDALMELDYVRVYQDVEKTIVSGPDLVLPGSEGTRYYVQPVEGATYTWTAPSGSSIASGQGTPVATVDWATTTGNLEVQIDAPTCSTSISREVEVLQPNCEETLLNFEDTARLSWISTDGVYEDDDTNPAPNAVNNSPQVARYERNPSVAFNVLRYTSDGFNDAGLLKSGDLVLEMDVYSNAPAGAQISIQLENMARASLAYPSGRNSVYQAVTTKSNEWERLRFNFALAPDGTLSNNEINQLLILFQPGTSSNAFFWFDNLRVVDAACSATGIQSAVVVDAGKVWPQPFSDQLNWRGTDQALEAVLIDQLGRNVMPLPIAGSEGSWTLANLADGYYWLRIRTTQGWLTRRVVKIANP